MTVIIRRKNVIKRKDTIHIYLDFHFANFYLSILSKYFTGKLGKPTRSESEFLIPMSEINDIAAVNSR